MTDEFQNMDAWAAARDRDDLGVACDKLRVAQAELTRLSAELAEAKQYKCPIGGSPNLCSAGYCAACAADLRLNLMAALADLTALRQKAREDIDKVAAEICGHKLIRGIGVDPMCELHGFIQETLARAFMQELEKGE